MVVKKMVKVFLQEMVNGIKLEELPFSWNSFDLKSFSKDKTLWDFQQQAIENALKVLWKYYEDFADFQPDESLDLNLIRKQEFFRWYKDNEVNENLDIKIQDSKLLNLLTEYYSFQNNIIPYENYINRMCFWMATGSGKTLVIIKLIQILQELIKRKEIPDGDILFLTYRDDLITQFKKIVDEVNCTTVNRIELRELKEYPEIKRQRNLFRSTVFYYRADNIGDEQKKEIIDFRNYDNNGKWYIFLDEAHKGDKEESKRQHIYSILSRNGFLFNFSATFTDLRDIITTAFEFNLASFIRAGFGKHISVLRQEIRAFRDNEDYSGDEKQKIVLKSLILLTYVKKFYEDIRTIQPDLYHKPLLLVLVNSVSTEDADLKLFFREIKKIGEGKIDDKIFESSKEELWNELKDEPEFMFEDNMKVKVDKTILENITKEDILLYVYNSNTSGEIEVLTRSSDKKEIAFKLKTSDKPFALIKIGDASSWSKNELVGYEIQEKFEDESYFESLNQENSDINILMGSRAFYEGWDSNRPNVVNFINIGVGEKAKKFILQSIGRGIRIEPIKNIRKRMLYAYNAKQVDEELFRKVQNKILPLETLFIFATNRKVLETVTEELKKEKQQENNLSLSVNEAAKKYTLLVPQYKKADYLIIKKRKNLSKFEINQEEINFLKRYIEFLSDDRLLLMRYDTDLEKIKILKESILNPNNYYKPGNKKFKNIDLLIYKILAYFNVIPEELKRLKELEEEIKHFKNIKVYLEDISELQEKIETVKNYPQQKEMLEKEYGEIPFEEYIEKLKSLKNEEEIELKNGRVKIKYIPEHYYIPILLSNEGKINYIITHIIKTPSEVKFIASLEEYLKKPENKFKKFNWWMFSKLVEKLDEIYIPYYYPDANGIAYYYPDFIFWLQKGDNYFIVFIDPKGTKHTDYMHKVDGYKMLFEEENGKKKVFLVNNLKVKVFLFLYTTDVNELPQEGYRNYWVDSIDKILEIVLSEL